MASALLDVAILGTPKSGTTSLFRWLADHPGVQASRPKEPFFFMDPEHPFCGRHGRHLGRDGLEAYSRFFAEPRNGRHRLEGTSHYLYQRTAMAALASLPQKPLAVVLLRDPSVRILSSFRFTQDTLAEIDRRLSFDTYVDLLVGGRIGEARPFYTSARSFYVAANELEMGRYAAWIGRWRQAFGAERLCVFVFEEMLRDPQCVVRSICERIGLDAGFYHGYEFAAANRTVRVENRALHRVARWVNERLPRGSLRQGLKRLYLKHQVRAARAERLEATDAALSKLDEVFRPWNQALRRDFGVDVSSWRAT